MYVRKEHRMKWRKYTIHTTAEAEEPVCAMLSELGIEGIQIEDYMPVAPEDSGNMFGDVVPQMPENDHRARISFYIEVKEEENAAPAKAEDPEGNTDKSFSVPEENGIPQEEAELLWKVQKKLEELKQFCDAGEGRITRSETEDKDWINRWKEYFHRFFVDDIEIIPSWEEEEPDEGASMVLHIDPGTAFGTGKHETTQLAIRQLRKYVAEGDGKTVLDIGTGSGILGIVALKSGAASVYGTDIDPVAFPALEDNLQKNAIDNTSFQRVCANVITDESARKAAQEACPEGYDIVTANIIAEILTDLTPFIPAFLKEGGIYITSGILREKEPLIRDAMKKAKMKVLEVTYQGDWCSVTAQKPTKKYQYFQHRECEYFPCHAGEDPENFNCLFCYCPLHFLGNKCPGTPRFTEKGVKDCTKCSFPHRKENYETVVRILKENKYFDV